MTVKRPWLAPAATNSGKSIKWERITERFIGLLTAAIIMLPVWCARADSLPQQVTFRSADGRTTLSGYLFMPPDRAGRHAAVVMRHGRSGAYSTNAKGGWLLAMLRLCVASFVMKAGWRLSQLRSSLVGPAVSSA
jgi:hypothetical protein